jgi:hypothetical protein
VDEEPPLDSEGDEYIWPEIQDEYEDDCSHKEAGALWARFLLNGYPLENRA